jgi:hypothetical protein
MSEEQQFESLRLIESLRIKEMILNPKEAEWGLALLERGRRDKLWLLAAKTHRTPGDLLNQLADAEIARWENESGERLDEFS